MSTNQTPNYGLNQWERTDKILMEDFNADNAKLDAALAGLAQVTAAHAAELAKKGSCTVGTFSYQGTGTYGTANPTRIQFPKLPAAFIIYGGYLMIGIGGVNTASQVYGMTSGGGAVGTRGVSWSGRTLSLVSTDRAAIQMNQGNTTYWVIAFYSES